METLGPWSQDSQEVVGFVNKGGKFIYGHPEIMGYIYRAAGDFFVKSKGKLINFMYFKS